MKFDRGLNGVDKSQHLNVWVTHVPRGVKVAKIIKRVDRAEDIIADQPVTGQRVKSIKCGTDPKNQQLTRSHGHALWQEGAHTSVWVAKRSWRDIEGMDGKDLVA